ncbi:Zn-ribbon domain-containing OB-fold protein [Rhizorhabdus wittichii]|uniref:Zn-ribbon domain-containing OB-fold protein n=1 Tax=Rhizorhabdus wittichii TaxID=160791 RepID=UPI0002FD5FA5|nr:OB-fold domain-containing protein [Rhizorhabdus wittichii]
MIQPEAEWRAHLAEGRFMIQRSRSTGGHVFYPRIVEPGTGADDLEWVEASGKGVVHAVTVVRKKDPADSYNVVLVDLAEGPRLMSRVDGIDVDAVRIGMDVRARIVEGEGKPLLVFVPA